MAQNNVNRPNIIRLTIRGIYSLSFFFELLAKFSLLIMVPVVIATIVLRVLHINSTGAFELILLLGCVIFVASWPYTEVDKRHSRVDMLVSQLPERVQSIFDSITYFLSLVACCVSSFYSFKSANTLLRKGQVMSSAFPIPACVIPYIVSGIFAIFALVVFIHLSESLKRNCKK